MSSRRRSQCSASVLPQERRDAFERTSSSLHLRTVSHWTDASRCRTEEKHSDVCQETPGAFLNGVPALPSGREERRGTHHDLLLRHVGGQGLKVGRSRFAPVPRIVSVSLLPCSEES